MKRRQALASNMNRKIRSEVAYLASLTKRLSDQTGLPLDLAHKRVMALAVSARPRSSTERP